MQHLIVAESLQQFIEGLQFTLGALGASENTDLAQALEECLAGTKRSQLIQHEVSDVGLRLLGALSKKVLKAKKAAIAFFKAEQAYLASDEGAGAASLFAYTPAAVFRMASEDRGRALAKLEEVAARADLPAVLKPSAKKLVATLTDLGRALGAIASNDKKAEAASAAVLKAKQSVVTAMHRLEGKLKDRYPDDRDEVESYFRPFVSRHARKPAPAPAPAPVS